MIGVGTVDQDHGLAIAALREGDCGAVNVDLGHVCGLQCIQRRSVLSASASSRDGSGGKEAAPGNVAVGPHQNRAAQTHVDAVRRMRIGQLL